MSLTPKGSDICSPSVPPALEKAYENAVLSVLCQGASVGDVGSGPAALARRLAGSGLRLSFYCIDKSAKNAAAARAFSTEKIKVKAKAADARRLPQDFRGFDVITCGRALHEILDPKKHDLQLFAFAKQLFKRLRKGGFVVIGENFYPSSLSEPAVARYVASQRLKGFHADDREKFPDPQKVIAAFCRAGFGLVRKSTIRPYKEMRKREYWTYVFKRVK